MCGAERIEHAIAGLDVTDELDRLATNVRERAFTPREFTDRRSPDPIFVYLFYLALSRTIMHSHVDQFLRVFHRRAPLGLNVGG